MPHPTPNLFQDIRQVVNALPDDEEMKELLNVLKICPYCKTVISISPKGTKQLLRKVGDMYGIPVWVDVDIKDEEWDFLTNKFVTA